MDTTLSVVIAIIQIAGYSLMLSPLAALYMWYKGILTVDNLSSVKSRMKNFWKKVFSTSGNNFFGILMLWIVTYLGTIVLDILVFGYFVSTFISPWIGCPICVGLAALFIANNLTKIELDEFAGLLIFDHPVEATLSSGLYPIPYEGYIFGLKKFPTKKVPIVIRVGKIPVPDGTTATVTFKGSADIDRKNWITFSQIGGAEGASANLAERADPGIRNWVENTNFGPKTWVELQSNIQDVIPYLAKLLLGDVALPRIESDIPTSALLRYFTTPRPIQTESEKIQWGKDWSKLVALLPGTAAEVKRLREAIEARRKAVASLYNGSANFQDRTTGLIIRNLGAGEVEIGNGVAEEAAKAAKMAAQMAAATVDISNVIAQAQAIVKAKKAILVQAMTPEEESKLLGEEIQNLLVTVKAVNDGKATVIPDLKDAARIVAEILKGSRP